MFAWLETTPVADWVALSLWAYPSLLSCHIIGLAIVVGIFFTRDLRLAGIIHGIDPVIFVRLGRLAWFGFALNLTSGLLLFTSQASVFVSNIPFLIKISCITVGMGLAIYIQSRLARQLAYAGVNGGVVFVNDTGLRALACVSLLVWVAAISAGRLIAYF